MRKESSDLAGKEVFHAVGEFQDSSSGRPHVQHGNTAVIGFNEHRLRGISSAKEHEHAADKVTVADNQYALTRSVGLADGGGKSLDDVAFLLNASLDQVFLR